MKNLRYLITTAFVLFLNHLAHAQEPSAIVNFESADQGILVPRTDTSTVNASFSPPATGLLIYQSTDNSYYFYNGIKWLSVGGAGSDNLGDHMATENIQLKDFYLSNDGDDEGMHINNDGGVSLGVQSTSNRFEVYADSNLISEVLDQFSNATGAGQNITSAPLAAAQSFVADTTGDLTRIEIMAKKTNAGNSMIQLELRTGNDPNAGSVLATESFEVNSVTDSVYNIVFTSPISVSQNDLMVMILSFVSGDETTWTKQASDVYSGGNSFVSPSPMLWIPLAEDYWFKSFIEVPEVSEVSVLSVTSAQNVGIGNSNPNMSAALEINSVNKGLLIPRMTNAQITAISNPARGLQIYSLDDDCVHIYTGSTWLKDCGFDYGNNDSSPPLTRSWKQINNFGASPRLLASSFVLNDTAYVGLGFDGQSEIDFFKYDESNDSWSAIASFPPTLGRSGASSFVLGDTAYVGGGNKGGVFTSGFFKYDKTNNTWLPIASIPNPLGSSRMAAFTIGDTAYVGTGFVGSSHLNSFFKYDRTNNTWTPIASFPGAPRKGAVAFTIGDFAYVGTGNDGTQSFSDFYRYDPQSNSWSSIADMPGLSRSNAVSFVLDGKGYVGTGANGSDFILALNDFYYYDPESNIWTASENFIGTERRQAIAFTLGETAYVGTGDDGSTVGDMFAYCPDKYFQSSNANGEAMWVIQESIAEKSLLDEYWLIDGVGNMSNGNSKNIIIDGNTLMVDVASDRVGIGTSTPSATLDVDGSAVFNNNSLAVDFRIESNNNENMFFVDGIDDNIGIGTNTPDFDLDVEATAAADIVRFNNLNNSNNADVLILKINQATPSATNFYLRAQNSAGNTIGGITGNGTGNVNFATTSDRRLKTNIQNFDGALDMLLRTQPRKYEFLAAPGIQSYGFIAQELQEVYPRAVIGSANSDVSVEPMMIDYSKITPLLAGAIIELNEKVEKSSNTNSTRTEREDIMQEEIKTLKNEIAELRKMIEQMQKEK